MSADIYSLGIVLYWMLNNRRMPFIPQTKEPPSFQERETARMRRLKGETLPPPVSGSPELQRIVVKCCAYLPADRYTSASELIADLTAYQQRVPDTDGGTTKTGGDFIEPTAIPACNNHALLVRGATGEVYHIRKDITVLGRKPELADLVITENHAISREHAALVRRQDGRYLLHNMRPKSGTGVNGRELEWDRDAELDPCAEITLADEQFLFLYGGVCASACKERKICILRCIETGELRLLTGEKLELNRNHKWREGVLGDRRISRERHAEVFRENECYFLRHLNALNSTTCNSRRLVPDESVKLHSGDVISIVDTEFIYMELGLT